MAQCEQKFLRMVGGSASGSVGAMLAVQVRVMPGADSGRLIRQLHAALAGWNVRRVCRCCREFSLTECRPSPGSSNLGPNDLVSVWKSMRQPSGHMTRASPPCSKAQCAMLRCVCVCVCVLSAATDCDSAEGGRSHAGGSLWVGMGWEGRSAVAIPVRTRMRCSGFSAASLPFRRLSFGERTQEATRTIPHLAPVCHCPYTVPCT
jgi:hypothetical protein